MFTIKKEKFQKNFFFRNSGSGFSSRFYIFRIFRIFRIHSVYEPFLSKNFWIISNGWFMKGFAPVCVSLLLFLFVFPWYVFTSMLTYVGHTTRSRWSNLNVTCHSRSHWRGIPGDQIFPVKWGQDLLKMYTKFCISSKVDD